MVYRSSESQKAMRWLLENIPRDAEKEKRNRIALLQNRLTVWTEYLVKEPKCPDRRQIELGLREIKYELDTLRGESAG